MQPLLLTSFERTARWMRRGGRESDVVLSSRVRLARNLRRYEFPHHAPANDLMAVRHRTFNALNVLAEQGHTPEMRFIPFEEFTGWERQSLIDRHLSSREHIRDELGRGVAATADGSIALLVNEEDHLRVQTLLPGLQLDSAYNLADKLDDALESHFDAKAGGSGAIAYSDDFGYLTACPTNAGTGMRASAMMHLPGLEIVGKLDRSRRWAEEHGLALRGTFGEGSKVWGHLHQLSNQSTLGVDESEIVVDVENAARELCEMERAARATLPRKHSVETRDRVGRAFGNLRYARKIGCREATDHLSMLRLGSELGWVRGLSRQRFNELLVWIRPHYLQVLHGRAIRTQERDEVRATLLRPHLERVRLEPAFHQVSPAETKGKVEG